MSKFPERNNERGDAVPHILRQNAVAISFLVVLVMGALLSQEATRPRTHSGTISGSFNLAVEAPKTDPQAWVLEGRFP
jgi:hypothetical protein